MKETSETSAPIKQKIDFTESGALAEELVCNERTEGIKKAAHFHEDGFLLSAQQKTCDLEVAKKYEDKTLKEGDKPSFLKTKLILIFLCMLVFAESFVYVDGLIEDFNALDAAWLGFFLFIFGSFILTGVTEYASLKKLKNAEDARHQSDYFLSSHAIGNAATFCNKLCLPLENDYSDAIKAWRSGVLNHHTNSEVVELFDDIVIAEADKKAIHIVRKQATATAALIGVSPLAAVDMMVVFIRHWQMINQVSHAYGLRLGYGARIQLLRCIIKNMIYAGSSEILLEASAYALGSSLTAKLSTKVAQGLGAGALTGRLGLQVIAQCRPVEWKGAKKPTLASITSRILGDLRSL